LLGHGRDEVSEAAVRLALAQASGLRRSFGSDAKAIQVGAAAAAGLTSARLAHRGATATADLATGPGGFEEAFGGSWAQPDDRSAVAENWIKAYPCCLQTHTSIEAAARVRERGEASWHRPGAGGSITVTVHPRARQAAPYDDVQDGLAAKFSIPYTVAYTLLHGPPLHPRAFAGIDRGARALASRRVAIRLDDSLPETAAVLRLEGHEPLRVESAIGSPARPMTDDQLAAKRELLAGGRLDLVIASPAATAREVLDTAGLA
jgi:2-methylcitrate dehydratase PrpD